MHQVFSSEISNQCTNVRCDALSPSAIPLNHGEMGLMRIERAGVGDKGGEASDSRIKINN